MLNTYKIYNTEGEVVNTIVATEEFVESKFPNQYELIVREIDEPIEQPPTVNKKITKLAFLNRFTMPESVAIDLASQGATPEAAYMRVYMRKVEAATFIDLDRDDTRNGVMAMEQQGILAEGRALEILDSPVQEIERYKG